LALATNNEVVTQAQAGDFVAFEVLVSRYERPSYATAWHLTHNMVSPAKWPAVNPTEAVR
jgi:hypothetical protein